MKRIILLALLLFAVPVLATTEPTVFTHIAFSEGLSVGTLGSYTSIFDSSGNATISGGTITGITDLAIADGGTGASTASAARTALGLAIESDVQAYDAGLANLASLTMAANEMYYTSADNTHQTASLTAFGRSILDDADASAVRTTLGLVINTNVQAWDAQLDDIAALVQSDSYIIVGDGTNWVEETGATARTSLGLGTIATQAADSVDLDGGAIDGATIGANSAAAGTFTTLTGNSVVVDDGDADVTIDSDNQTDASAAINIPDFGDATADFLVTNIFKTWLPFAGGLGGEDSDAVGTNGAGLLGGGAIDITTYDYNDGAAGANDVLCKVYDHGTTTWDDLKTAALLTGWTNNYQLTPDADQEATSDAFAIGFDEQFCEVAFNDFTTGNGALATWGGAGGKWQYSTGAGTWSDLTVYDGTDANDQTGGQPLSQTGAISFAPPSDWAAATYDGEEAYWIQWVFTAAQLTQAALIDDTNKDEPIIPFPSDSLDAPYKCEIVAVRVTNFQATVHDQIIKFVVGNFTDGTFSAELSWTASQISDRFTLASAIACDADDVIGILVTDDGGATNNPIWMTELEVSYED